MKIVEEVKTSVAEVMNGLVMSDASVGEVMADVAGVKHPVTDLE